MKTKTKIVGPLLVKRPRLEVQLSNAFHDVFITPLMRAIEDSFEYPWSEEVSWKPHGRKLLDETFNAMSSSTDFWLNAPDVVVWGRL